MAQAFKVVLLGDTSVGKTCIFTRLTKDIFSPNSEPTVGAHFSSKLVSIPDSHKQMKL